MNRRRNKRTNMCDFPTENPLEVINGNDFQSYNVNGDQLYSILRSFKNEILQRMDDNNKTMRKLIIDTKHEIVRKINNFDKQVKSSQSQLKDDLFRSFDSLKSLTDQTGIITDECNPTFLEDYEVENVGFSPVKSTSTFKLKNNQDEPTTPESLSCVKDKTICSTPNDDSLFHTEEQAAVVNIESPEESLEAHGVNEVIRIGEKIDSESQANKSLDVDGTNEIKFNDVEIGLKSRPLEILSDVANKVDCLYRRLNSAPEALFNAGIDQKGPNAVGVVEGGDVPRINEPNEIEVENNGSQVAERKTGAIKKVFKDVPGKSLELTASTSEDLSDAEMEEIVKRLANVLDIQYDKQNLRVLFRQSSIVIQFRSEEELEKWRGSAQQIIEKAKFSYQELLNLEDVDVIYNIEKMECPVCLMECDVGEGITLRDCLHSFCRQCIIKTVEHNTELEVTCPFAADDYVCQSVIQHREIKEIVPKELYDQYVDKSLLIIGNRLENTVHCKTPDCRNFYICDENVSAFYCDSCKSTNCIPCKAVHTGMDCKEYQDELRIKSETDAKARETLRMFETMIKNKEAMPCPQCQVIVMKDDGCDWIQCSMCKTEICWATLGPRWGPAGRGDTSGGCLCKVNGVACHVKCRNCH